MWAGCCFWRMARHTLAAQSEHGGSDWPWQRWLVGAVGGTKCYCAQIAFLDEFLVLRVLVQKVRGQFWPQTANFGLPSSWPDCCSGIVYIIPRSVLNPARHLPTIVGLRPKSFLAEHQPPKVRGPWWGGTWEIFSLFHDREFSRTFVPGCSRIFLFHN